MRRFTTSAGGNARGSSSRTGSRAGARYFTGCPAICPNLDVLSEVRGTEALMMDLVLEPEWVHRKLDEIHRAFVETYQEIYDITREEDGSSVFAYFMIWAPGTVCLAQCDTAGMISREMFVVFVRPKRARWRRSVRVRSLPQDQIGRQGGPGGRSASHRARSPSRCNRT